MLTLFLAAWLWVIACIIATMILWRLTPRIAEAPLLDVVLMAYTWGPWVVAFWVDGWRGFALCFAGQFMALQTFAILHSAINPRPNGSIRRTLDRIVGPLRNHLGLWITIPALPAFLMLRFAEMFTYPLLVWTLGFPGYKQAEWVNVSRQKFSGLIGHDLVWCLYCDWMTGTYSLGGEMLRNVESFWCPIKFYPGKKCENCKIAFPDIDVWVPADGSMKDVEKALKAHYSPKPGTPRSWWGHGERKGAELPPVRKKDRKRG